MKIRLFFALFWQEVENRLRGTGILALAVRALLYGGLAAAFVWFYAKFSAVYSAIGEREARRFELLSLSLEGVFALAAIGSASGIVRSVRLAEDLRLFSAMPVSRRMLLCAKLLAVYMGQFFLCAFAVPVIVHFSGTGARWESVVFAQAALPLAAMAVGALLAFPAHELIRFFRGKFFLSFLCGTALFGAGLYLYCLALGGVKELLLGGDLKYFFGERTLTGIAYAAEFAYPANLFASFLAGRGTGFDALLLLGICAVCVAACLLCSGALLRGMFLRNSPPEPRFSARWARRSPFAALLGKEFVQIFRTPPYAFSYFSVAVVMPLMVCFCMSVGSSLVERLLGIDCAFELALFLTLLYSALTNVFCATNVSRDGKMFYAVKAMPVTAWQVFSAKVCLSMSVVTLALLVASASLFFVNRLSLSSACLVFAFGLLFSFAQVCFSTKYDFSHARFPSETDGEAAEGEAASFLWFALSLLIGVGLLALKLLRALRFGTVSAAGTALFAGGICLAAAILSALFLFLRLRRRYEAFAGGGI